MNLQGLRILITGGAGFIGSHITEALVEDGAKIIVYDNFSTGKKENLRNVINEIEIIEGDILDYKKLEKVTRKVDVISHHAAQLEITKCIEDPCFDLKINTIGTLNVLKAGLGNGVKKIIFASSACVYGQAIYTPQDENHPTFPNWQYGVSKLAAEKYCRIFSSSYGIPIISLRYSIVYGEREWFGRVLTIFLKRALEGKPLVIFGDGEVIRDFIYVKDLVRFHNIILEKDNLAYDVFNVSSAIPVKIKELAETVLKVTGASEILYEQVREGEFSKLVEGRMRLPQELKVMHLDNKRAKELGWQPVVSLEDGIRAEFEWLKANPGRWEKMSY